MSDDPPFVVMDGRAPAPAELFCPHCGYNVSFTVEDRCPECGREFDRAFLADWTTGFEQPLPFKEMGPGAPSAPAALALFSPTLLGRWLPPRPEEGRIRTQSLWFRLAGAVGVPFLLTLFTESAYDILRATLAIAIPAMLCSIGCEMVIAGLLGRWVPPRAVRAGSYYRFWRSLGRIFTVYLLVHTSLVSLLIGLMRLPAGGSVGFFPLTGSAVALGWWWVSLARAIVARSEPSAARTIVLFLMPVVGLAAYGLCALLIGVGFFIAFA